MNKFTIETRGNLTRIQYGHESHIVCTGDELAQLRELLGFSGWQEKPSGEGKYVRMPLPHLPYIVSFVDVWNYRGQMLANGEGDTARPVEELGGFWLKLPDLPALPESKEGNTK